MPKVIITEHFTIPITAAVDVTRETILQWDKLEGSIQQNSLSVTMISTPDDAPEQLTYN